MMMTTMMMVITWYYVIYICQVLVNFGVDVNSCTRSGITPLYSATAAKANQVIHFLTERGAKLELPDPRIFPGATVLDTELPSRSPVLNVVGDKIGMPHQHTWYWVCYAAILGLSDHFHSATPYCMRECWGCTYRTNKQSTIYSQCWEFHS